MAIPQRLEGGKRLADDDAINVALATPQWQTNYGITAVGTALTNATPRLSLGANVVTASTGSNYGVALPFASAGSVVHLRNADSADAVTVFASSGQTVDGGASVSVAAGKTILFVAGTNGVWFSLLSA